MPTGPRPIAPRSDTDAVPVTCGTDQVSAGAFGDWLAGFVHTLDGNADAVVACGTCDACCRSSQFIHIGPQETDALAHIPAALRFAAPGMPGHQVMGFDASGRCPMLGDSGCTIYAHRPRTCRTYDCRVFAAAGIDPAAERPLIAVRAVRWRFDLDDRSRALRDAVVAEAEALHAEHGRSLTEVAVVAVRRVAERSAAADR